VPESTPKTSITGDSASFSSALNPIALQSRKRCDILGTGVTGDGKPVTTNVDAVSNSSFQLSPAAVDKLGLSEDLARAHTSSSVGFNGALDSHEGTVRNVAVGKISVNNPPVIFLGKGMGMDEESWDLRIGSAFFKDYAVTLDFRHGQITLARAVDLQPEH